MRLARALSAFVSVVCFFGAGGAIVTSFARIGAAHRSFRGEEVALLPQPDAEAPAIAEGLDEEIEDAGDPEPATLAAQREALYGILTNELGLSASRVDAVRSIFERSTVLGQGNPSVSKHPMTRAECRAIRAAEHARDDDGAICGSKYMVPLYEPRNGEKPESAKVCIDQFEFPGVPCEYPVVNVRANEAVELCAAVGKRICDAHEWEGACAGDLRPADVEYAWGKPRPEATWFHNEYREKTWAYGGERDLGLCGTGSSITPGCPGGGWRECGSNTYPTGAFPQCVSPFGVYDQHGNAAEHMNLATSPEELASRGGLGQTEMKGSWFIFASIDAHDDDCRWRARDWHPSRVDNANSHRNYHLGFRCCADRTPGEAAR